MNKTTNNSTINSPSYGRCFDQWRGACPAQWRAYTQHDFVSGLGDGSLPRSSFLRYLRQDYIFLTHFSRAWALAIVKADDLAEMKVASATVHALIHEEMQLHVRICAAEGINEQQLSDTREAPQNIAYTRYVLEAGYSGDFLDLLAALAPCVMGYGEIGVRLAASEPADVYRDWIDTYANDEYQTLCRDVGLLIDNAVIARLGTNAEATPRWHALCDRFRTATELEADFWQMGLSG
jgi:thiaminase (transcriptional activator TenA)